MRKYKLLFWAIIADILLYQLLPLHIFGIAARQFVYPFIWLSFLLAGMCMLPTKKSFERNFLVVAGSLIYGFLTLILAFVFYLFCGWGSHGTFYTNRKNPSLKLVCLTYECYGTADPCQLYKQHELLPRVYWVTEFKEQPIDTTVWKKER